MKKLIVATALTALLATSLGSAALAGSETDLLHAKPLAAAEVKVEVRAEDIERALQVLRLSRSEGDEMGVYFFDTPTLDLYHAHIILRARKTLDNGGASDLVVKVRPIDSSTVSHSWLNLKGFKCSLDATRTSSAEQCVMKQKMTGGDLESMVSGRSPVRDTFTADQIQYAEAYGPHFDWNSVRPLGPVDSVDWSIGDENDPVSAELWTLQGQRFLELSKKCDVDSQTETRAEILKLLSDNGIGESDSGEFKTEFVMRLLEQNPR